MLQAFFHAWERRLASVTTDRVVRPFEWGLEWIPQNGHPHRRRHPGDVAAATGSRTSCRIRTRSSRRRRPSDYHFEPAADGSGLPDVSERARDAASRQQHGALPVLPGATVGTASHGGAAARVERRRRCSCMPQWNADPGGHVGLCRLLAWNGMSALRLSLPYHDQRMPPELHRADYIVSANVARTVQVCRQAVLDARRAIAWLAVARLRPHRHPRHEPRLVPGAADDGARAAHPGRGAQSHLAAVRRRGVARPVDAPRARRSRGAHRARSAARAVEADQPAVVSRAPARSADAARLRAIRSDLPASICRKISCARSASAASLTRSRFSDAATTAPARRRSSSSMAGC